MLSYIIVISIMWVAIGLLTALTVINEKFISELNTEFNAASPEQDDDAFNAAVIRAKIFLTILWPIFIGYATVETIILLVKGDYYDD